MVTLASFIKDLSTTARVGFVLAMKDLSTTSVWVFGPTSAFRIKDRRSFARLLSHTRIPAPYPATAPGVVAVQRT